MFTNKTKRLAAMITAPVAAVGLMIAMGTVGSASAAISGSNTTGSTLGTVPQCAWHLDGVSTGVTLTHADATKYKGVNYIITGTTGSIDTYVAPTAASSKPSSPGADDCSWYSTKQGASITVGSGASPAFTSTTFGAEDTSMNFSLGDSSHKLTATVNPSCTGSWAAPSAGANDIYTGHVSATVTSLAYVDADTTSACTYTIGYSVTVPGGLNPTNAGQNYAMTGPSLTTTLTTSNS